MTPVFGTSRNAAMDEPPGRPGAEDDADDADDDADDVAVDGAAGGPAGGPAGGAAAAGSFDDDTTMKAVSHLALRCAIGGACRRHPRRWRALVTVGVARRVGVDFAVDVEEARAAGTGVDFAVASR
jgi:hypothetical protein